MRQFAFITVLLLLLCGSGCGQGGQEAKDREVVQNQQAHYAKGQPLPFFDFSIPRDILSQIYHVVTTESRSTYSVIESMTGETRFHGPSIGYGIPADTQLTNPLQPQWTQHGTVAIEQAEPNGLFSSKNTDGTWVLFVDANGDITPIYTEHKVTTFPFIVRKDENGTWVRADDKKASFTIKLKDGED